MIDRARREEYEEAVVRIWTKILQPSEAIAHDANFFDAGGSSLGLLRLSKMLGSHFGVDVRGVDLFLHTTIEKQAKYIAERLER